MIAKRVPALSSNGLEFIDRNLVLKLDDNTLGYNIVMEEMYKNVEACANQEPSVEQSLRSTDKYATCFFSLPFIRASAGICDWFKSGEAARYSSKLQLQMNPFDDDQGCFEGSFSVVPEID